MSTRVHGYNITLCCFSVLSAVDSEVRQNGAVIKGSFVTIEISINQFIRIEMNNI